MSIQKVLSFSKYGNWDTDNDPTTPQEMHDFMENQNNVLTALASRLWQPNTVHYSGDVIFSPSMKNGVVAKCVSGGTTGATEPAWGSIGDTYTDGECKWQITDLKGDKGDSGATDGIVFSVGENNMLHIEVGGQ